MIDTAEWIGANATSGWCWCLRCKTKEPVPRNSQADFDWTLAEFVSFAEEFALKHDECKP